MVINKSRFLKQFLSLISRLADKNYQLRVWVKGMGPECEFFDDIVCDFFDDCDPLLENYQDFGLTEKQYQILKTFRDEFEAFSDENSWPPFFINSPEWAHIMERAREVLKVFHFEKKDPEGSS